MRKVTKSGAIKLIGAYIKVYIQDYGHNPDSLKRVLKEDRLVGAIIDDDYVDYIVRETKRLRGIA